MDTDIQITDLHGPIVFLNGDEGLSDLEQDVYDSWFKVGCKIEIIDRLYEPGGVLGLDEAIEFKHWVIFSTGLRRLQNEKLVEKFQKLKYVPETVIFLSEDSIMTFLGTARELKKSGTSFYRPDWTKQTTLYPIEWV